jgi:hypothetical protein
LSRSDSELPLELLFVLEQVVDIYLSFHNAVDDIGDTEAMSLGNVHVTSIRMLW